MILGIIYGVGYLWFWRHHVGFFIHEMAYGEPDGEDIVFGLFMGTLSTFFWPLTVAGVIIRNYWIKWGADRVGGLEKFFPDPFEPKD